MSQNQSINHGSMVERKICDFSGELIEPGTGLMYVTNDGKVYNFKDSKSEKYFLRGENPKKTAWTKTAHDDKESGVIQVEKGDPIRALQKQLKSINKEQKTIGQICMNENFSNGETLNQDVLDVLKIIDSGEVERYKSDLQEHARCIANDLDKDSKISSADVIAMLVVVEFALPNFQPTLERGIKSFAVEIPEDPGSDAGDYSWSEVRRDVFEFLVDREEIYQAMSSEVSDIAAVRREHLRTILGDRLRYV